MRSICDDRRQGFFYVAIHFNGANGVVDETFNGEEMQRMLYSRKEPKERVKFALHATLLRRKALGTWLPSIFLLPGWARSGIGAEQPITRRLSLTVASANYEPQH